VRTRLDDRPTTAQRPEAAAVAVPTHVRGAQRRRLQRALGRAAAAYPLREESGPATWTEPLAQIRYAALEIGRRAHARGVLDSPDDVFWLDQDELRAVATGAAPDPRTPADRRRRAESAGTHAPPPTLGANPGPPGTEDLPSPARWLNEGLLWLVGRMLEPARLSAGAASGSDLAGVGAAHGRATGPVRVVRHDRDLDGVRPGDVLVCPTLDAGWTVVLPTVAALVTDSGGTLSHSAIMAREFGVPTVVASGNASTVLTDGQLVEVDGDQGTVQLRGSSAASG
jgi:phosphohistidine swiveling domain-containing protein